eukprot:gene15725-biopygen15764
MLSPGRGHFGVTPRPPFWGDSSREKRQRTRTGRAPDARRTRAARLPDAWRTRAGRAPDARRTRAEPFLPGRNDAAHARPAPAVVPPSLPLRIGSTRLCRGVGRGSRRPGTMEPGRRHRTPRGSPGTPGGAVPPANPFAVRGVPDMFQHLFEETGPRSFQTGAGTSPARHERRLTSSGKSRAPGDSEDPWGPGSKVPGTSAASGLGRAGSWRYPCMLPL